MKVLFDIYKVLGRIGIKPKDIMGMSENIIKMGKSLFNTRPNPKLLTFIEKNQKIPTKILENIKLHARTLQNASESQKNLFLENIKSIEKAKSSLGKELRQLYIVPKSQSPVTGVQKQATSDKGIEIIHNLSRKLALKAQKAKNLKMDTLPTAWQAEGRAGSIAARVQDVKGWTASQLDKLIKSEKQLSKILDDWAYGAARTAQSFKKSPAIEKVIDFKGWKPTVIKGGKDPLATGGIANHFRAR